MTKRSEEVERFLVYFEDILSEKNMSVPQFAKLMNMPSQTVYKWLNRESIMSLKAYFKTLKILDISEKLSSKSKPIKVSNLKL